VFVVCYAGSGLCDELITRSEEYYRLCVRVWSRNIKNKVAEAQVGLLHHKKKMMRCPGHVAGMGLRKGTGNFCLKTLKDLEDLRVGRRIILKLLLYIQKMRFWAGLICLGQWPLASVNTAIPVVFYDHKYQGMVNIQVKHN